ncbi:MAG: acetyl-CoA carboxylase biotin carboxyl carrier protein [Alphaproteobacteria bacterium]|jgi:acetyl-CoA carboxylase biotin carboxyl carrier protein
MTKIDSDAIRELAKLLDETGLTEIEINEGDSAIRVSRAATINAASAAPAVAMAGAAALSIDEASTAEVPGTVPSPMVGTIYMASGPGEAPFVKTGDQVSEGQTLLIVEAMKVMNPILAPRAGTVSAIFVEDGHPVEFGEALLAIT